MQEIWRLPAVEAKAGFRRSKIDALVREGKFPAPIRIGKRSRGWVATEVEEWIKRRIAEARNYKPTHQNARNPRTGRWDKAADPADEAPRSAQVQRSADGRESA